MILFITALILLVVAIGWYAFNPKVRVPTGERDDNYNKVYEHHPTRKYAWILVGLAILCGVLSCVTQVPARNVGVLTNFGAVQDNTFSPGLHVKAPWTKVTDIDATVQPEEYKGDDCIYVKIADGGSACITLAYRWKINAENAERVYAEYNNSERAKEDGLNGALRSAVVSTNIKAAINEVLGQWDPLDGADITANSSTEELSNIKLNVNPDYEQWNADIKSNLEGKVEDLGGLVDIESVTVSFIKLPERTQDRIDVYNASIQDLKTALVEKARKSIEADANRILAASLSNDPNVLVSKCLDAVIDGAELPAGFQCWSGTGGSVVVPSK